jgi:AcrR family transcriptional regulator
MARASPAARLSEVARAARVVFTEKGYKRALISDVTDELGLSHGAIYGYVESKAALFHLAVLSAIGVDWDEVDLPVPVPTVPLSEVFVRLTQWSPELDAGLRRRRTAAAGDEFTAIIDECYGAIERHRRLLTLLERCAADIPELAELYFRTWRRDLVSDLAKYLSRRIGAGSLRPVPNVATAARFIVETMAWFAMHRKRDPDSFMISDDDARTTVRTLLANAFVPETPAGGRSGAGSAGQGRRTT